MRAVGMRLMPRRRRQRPQGCHIRNPNRGPGQLRQIGDSGEDQPDGIAAKLVTLRKTNPSEMLLIAGLKQGRSLLRKNILKYRCSGEERVSQSSLGAARITSPS
jgi:hypothetical protein